MRKDHNLAVVPPTAVECAIEALQSLAGISSDDVQRHADRILLQLVEEMGLTKVVEEYHAALERAAKIN